MSSTRAYQGRHTSPRRARPLSGGTTWNVALPSAAAVALILTATGASVASTSTQVPPASANVANLLADRDAVVAARSETREQLALRQDIAEERQADARRATAKRIAARKAKAARAEARAEARKRAHEAALRAARAWRLPVAGYTLSSGFGPRWGRMHAGTDFAAPIGTPLRAMSSGTVIFAGSQSGYGNKVEIRYADGTVSYYGHMNSIAVSVGQRVDGGDVVGEVGNTGRSTGPHLHLEIHPGGGGAVDPLGWMASKGLRP